MSEGTRKSCHSMGKIEELARPLISDVEGFKEVCQPIISYLRKHCNPYTEVHISMDNIKVTSVECGIPVKKNDD